jgi:hypothetical protein
VLGLKEGGRGRDGEASDGEWGMGDGSGKSDQGGQVREVSLPFAIVLLTRACEHDPVGRAK